VIPKASIEEGDLPRCKSNEVSRGIQPRYLRMHKSFGETQIQVNDIQLNRGVMR
jgi:hypothetical protein